MVGRRDGSRETRQGVRPETDLLTAGSSFLFLARQVER